MLPSDSYPPECDRLSIYSFHAVWTICWSANFRRAHIITSGNFKLLKGNCIQFLTTEDEQAERSFRLVCHYCHFFNHHSRQLSLPRLLSHETGHYHLWRGEVVGRNDYNQSSCAKPEIRGLSAIVETAIAIGGVADTSH